MPKEFPTNNNSDSYKTIGKQGEGLFKDRNSKFFYRSFKVTSEADVKDRLAELRKEFYDARHHCYAYVLGKNQEKFRAVDDGEPGHTAGDPILGQIRSHELTNILIVVVRYFGGTKLGVSGLINAYKTSAKECIENSEIVTEYVKTELRIKFSYPKMNEVMYLVKKHDLDILSQEMLLDCEFLLSFRESLTSEVLPAVNDIEGLIILKD